MNITLSYLRFNIDSKLFSFISNSFNRSCRAQNLVSNKTGFAIFRISYYFLLILQISSITSHEIISTLTQRSSNFTVYMGLDFAENTLTLSQLLHRVLHMNWKQRRRRGGSVPVGGGHAEGRGVQAVHREFVLGIRRRAGRPEGAKEVLHGEGGKLSEAGSSGRNLLHACAMLAPKRRPALPRITCSRASLHHRAKPWPPQPR
jgi:hypothetical protein